MSPVDGGAGRISRRRLLAGGLVLTFPGGCGTLRDTSTRLLIDIEADEKINLNEFGEPSPVVLRLFELKSQAAFLKAGFFDLFDNDAKALGSDLVNRREYDLKPGDKRKIEDTAGTDARSIGVVAGFRDEANAKWRDVRELVPESTNRLVVKVTALSVNFTVGQFRMF